MLFRRIHRNKTFSHFVKLEADFGCSNYKPLPVVISKGKGVHVWDVDNKKYFDCLSAYGAVNQGHCHPIIKETLISQLDKISLTSRAFYNDQLGDTCEYISKIFNYQRVILGNSGVEAGETAIKFARKWGYVKKQVPQDQAEVLFASNNFWGRTIAACGSSDDPGRYENFGPFNMGFKIIPYGDISAFETQLKANPNIVAFMLEPIQGEAGIIIPPEGYLKEVRQLCDKYNVLMIVDEVQTGMGRTGKMLALDWDNIQADMICLGKALSGGFFPVSAVLGTNEIFDCIKPGDHGSTFGGNPLACAVAKKSIEVLINEGMIENSQKMGQLLLEELKQILKGKDYIKGNPRILYYQPQIINLQISAEEASLLL